MRVTTMVCLSALLASGCWDFPLHGLQEESVDGPDQMHSMIQDMVRADLVGSDMAGNDMADDGMPDFMQTDDALDGGVPDLADMTPGDKLDGSDMVVVAMNDMADGGKPDLTDASAPPDLTDMIVPPDLTDLVMVAAVQVTSVIPSSASNVGGAMVTVNGNGFVNGQGLAIAFGGVPAANVAWVSAKQITCTVPAKPGFIGKTDVTVTNPDMSSATAKRGFGYFTPTLTFAPPSMIAVGNGPYFVAAPDVNGDGKPDLVTVNETDGTLAVMLGHGNGMFDMPKLALVQVGPRQAGFADFDEDGKLDAVVLNTISSTMSLLIGAGDGTFQKAVPIQTEAGPRAVGVADIDGDGHADVVVASSVGKSEASVFFGLGNGMFLAPVIYPVSGGPSSLVISDFNHDGKLDIAVENEASSGVSVLLYTGQRMFKGAFDYAATAPSNASAVAMGLIDDDVETDLVVSYGNGNGFDGFGSLLGKPDGTFRQGNTFDNKRGSNAAVSLAVADLDGDLVSDVVLADTGGSTVTVFRGSGNGAFPNDAAHQFNLRVGSTPTSVVVADLNGDSKLDIATANHGAANVSVLLNISP